ncbi:MMPL family transporter [Streptoalloteichus hindustanus]|uniref:Putative drug exporter of the RND superfamily n=1 Tax=Streptoalloteichus hindustanus TaxID=2017 RepID=A0A1M5EXT4_STRHI|nr:MMPL family transporter [Streptoalloteichus hindustanus]SHF84044.1 putative drug exporter of the RND superfamily [Streptoalloteichus hindustanus]
MLGWLARVVTRWAWAVVGIWVALVTALVLLAPALSSVVSSDSGGFLPADKESVVASKLAARAFPAESGAPAVMVFARRDGQPLQDGDIERVDQTVEALNGLKVNRVKGIATGEDAVARNRSVQLASVLLSGTSDDQAVKDAVARLRAESANRLTGTSLRVGMTGDAAISLDYDTAFVDAEEILTYVTGGLVVLLLLIVFRGVLATLLPIVVVGAVYVASSAAVALLASELHFKVGSFLPPLMLVVLFGIGTDYILFVLFRVRERLQLGDDPRTAVRRATHHVAEVIASAALAVVGAFLALALSDLTLLSTLGPAVAVGVVIMMLAGLTLVPAVLSLVGSAVFWPSRSGRRHRAVTEPRTARAVVRRPVWTVVVSALVLAASAWGALGYQPNFNFLDDVPRNSESNRAYQDLKSGFPAGALSPTYVYLENTGAAVEPEVVDRVAESARKVSGVSGLMEPQVSADGHVIRLPVLLAHDPSSRAALDDVEHRLRPTVTGQAPPGVRVLVGGETMTGVDIRATVADDLRTVLPLAALVIGLILVLLLRGVVAPLFLMVAVTLNFLGALGLTVVGFQNLLGEPGLMFLLPVLINLFVVAIGTDYNILVVARIREELRAGLPVRGAVVRAMTEAGPSALAAAAILAASFASLLLAGVGMLVQIGFAVAIGIALTVFAMALGLVPALVALLGRWTFWPAMRGRSAADVRPVSGSEKGAEDTDDAGDANDTRKRLEVRG